MSEYTNNLNVVSTYKGEKSVSITGTFQCGIHFPKSGAKPFKVIERTSKNNKQYKQIYWDKAIMLMVGTKMA